MLKFQASLLAAAILFAAAAPSHAEITEETKSVISCMTNKVAGFEVEISLNHSDGIYREGDTLSAEVKVNRECYVHLFNVNPNGKVQLLYPNEFQVKNVVSPKQQVSLPALDCPAKFVARAPLGEEHIVVLASLKPLNLRDQAESSRFRDFFRSLQTGKTDGVARLRSFTLEIAQENGNSGWVGRSVKVVTTSR